MDIKEKSNLPISVIELLLILFFFSYNFVAGKAGALQTDEIKLLTGALLIIPAGLFFVRELFTKRKIATFTLLHKLYFFRTPLRVQFTKGRWCSPLPRSLGSSPHFPIEQGIAF